jgi:hypothetical protein
MKPPKDNRSVWPDAIQELTLGEVRRTQVTFVDDLDDVPLTQLTMTRADWNAIGNKVRLIVGVWRA